MKLKAGAKVLVRPLGGQIIPFTLIVISAILFLVTIWLDAEAKSCALAAIGSIVSFLSGVGLYLLSRRDSDLQKAHPFSMTIGSGEKNLAISADSRSLPTLDYLKNMSTHLACLLEREPLPEANGVIDQHGNPIANSQAAAADITKKANDEAYSQLKDVALQMQLPATSDVAKSPVID